MKKPKYYKLLYDKTSMDRRVPCDLHLDCQNRFQNAESKSNECLKLLSWDLTNTEKKFWKYMYKKRGWSIRCKLFGCWRSGREVLLLFEKKATLQQRQPWKSRVKWKKKKRTCVYFWIELKYLIWKFSWGNVEFVEGFWVLF